MKRFIYDALIVFVLTILILVSYSLIKNNKVPGPRKIYEYISRKLSGDQGQDQPEHKPKVIRTGEKYHAVWLPYIEFVSYLNATENNDKESFEAFFQHVLDICKERDINVIIVQVRPFGDAIYESEYFPWASCISGQQGLSPGYDPLKSMVKLSHKNDIKIEAWINPYRVSFGNDINNLSEDNQARIWHQEGGKSARNVLEYEGSLYYNPASTEVRELIRKGVEEIVRNYDVDGIHMDDYFYPEFNEDNVKTAFDALEYNAGQRNGNISQNLSIADWRRDNVNQLVKSVYDTIKGINSHVTFGISPMGDLDTLRDDHCYYTDIDRWVSEKGYIDYIMPQIYWGYTNEYSPFTETLMEWEDLCRDPDMELYVGLQLYRMGTEDDGSSDYEELQSADVFIKQVNQVNEDRSLNGYSIFSYQYLDVEDETYNFDTANFDKKRKKILSTIEKYLMENK